MISTSSFSNVNLNSDCCVTQIQNNNYIFQIVLTNGNSLSLIKHSAIIDLTIIDDLRYFFKYGHLIFNDSMGALQKYEGINETGSSTINSKAEPYVYRGDGRDFLLIEIVPQLQEDDLCGRMSTSAKEKYGIKGKFSIYDIEDIKYEDNTNLNYKKYKFYDSDYQYLCESIAQFSTSDYSKTQKSPSSPQSVSSKVDKNISASNYDRSVYTGEAIEKLLKKVITEKYGEPFKKDIEWDKGNSIINYNSFGNKKAIDDLEYLLSYHVSTDQNFNLPCILHKTKYTNKYYLKPLNKFFEEANLKTANFGFSNIGGPGLIEDFFLGKLDTDSKGLNFSLNKSPYVSTNSSSINEYNLINDYTFQKARTKDIQKFMTSYAVHSSDPRGYNKVDLKQNNLENLQKTYNKTMVDTLPGRNGKKPYSIVPINQAKQDYQNVQHIYVPNSLDDKQRLNFGKNKGLVQMIFKNTSIGFEVRGLTTREAGKFITINRRDSSITPTYDNSLLGMYLVTYVRHEFKDGSYQNYIIGTKPYTFDKSKYVDMY